MLVGTSNPPHWCRGFENGNRQRVGPTNYGGNEITKNLKLFSSLIMAAQVGFLLPASAQQGQPLGTANAIGTVSNSNATATSSFNGTPSSSSGSSSTKVILLPNGRRVSTSNSTIVVCDDPGAPFPVEVDVCSLR